jgi:hypothetical protein
MQKLMSSGTGRSTRGDNDLELRDERTMHFCRMMISIWPAGYEIHWLQGGRKTKNASKSENTGRVQTFEAEAVRSDD